MATTINSKLVDAQAKQVTGTCTVSQKQGGPRFELNYRLDMTKLSPEEIMERAAQSEVIALQGRVRKNWSQFTQYKNGDKCVVDCAASEGAARLSDAEVARRTLVRLTGDSSIKLDDPRVAAMVEIAKAS